RIEPDRLVVVGNGAVDVALVLMLDTAVEIDFRETVEVIFARRDCPRACRDCNVARLVRAGGEIVGSRRRCIICRSLRQCREPCVEMPEPMSAGSMTSPGCKRQLRVLVV